MDAAPATQLSPLVGWMHSKPTISGTHQSLTQKGTPSSTESGLPSRNLTSRLCSETAVHWLQWDAVKHRHEPCFQPYKHNSPHVHLAARLSVSGLQGITRRQLLLQSCHRIQLALA